MHCSAAFATPTQRHAGCTHSKQAQQLACTAVQQCSSAAIQALKHSTHQSASTSCSRRKRSLAACPPCPPWPPLLPPSFELTPGGRAGSGPQPCARPAAALAPLPPLAVEPWAGPPPPEGGCGSHSGAELGTLGSDCADCMAGSCGGRVGMRRGGCSSSIHMLRGR